MKRVEAVLRQLNLLRDKMSSALHPTGESYKGHVDSSWWSVTGLEEPLLSFIAGVHNWTAVLYLKHSICRHWRQPVRDTHVLHGWSHMHLPFCPWGGGGSAQWTCGWLFFLKETLTSSFIFPFCDFFCLFTWSKHCEKFKTDLEKRRPSPPVSFSCFVKVLKSEK